MLLHPLRKNIDKKEQAVIRKLCLIFFDHTVPLQQPHSFPAQGGRQKAVPSFSSIEGMGPQIPVLTSSLPDLLGAQRSPASWSLP
jgi:hypothetical protein